MAQQGLWNVARKKMLQDRGALLLEGGDIVREYKAMHEDKFLGVCFREDVEDIEERRKNREEKAREEESRSGDRKVEREKERTVIKRVCVNLTSSDGFEEFSPADDSGSFGCSWSDLYCDPCRFSECACGAVGCACCD